MGNDFFTDQQDKIDLFDQFLADSLEQRFSGLPSDYVQNLSYTLKNGGKRFRPLLCILIAEAFAVNPRKVLPWALAIEMIHTYSLIHDDLPCMDNDSVRRGQPTQHVLYGEGPALLVGDALLTEAFWVIANGFPAQPDLAIDLVNVLSQAAGCRGMVYGQYLDISKSNNDFETIHQLKTGMLIKSCGLGCGKIMGLDSGKLKLITDFCESLGLSFQIKDDLLDDVGKQHQDDKLQALRNSDIKAEQSLESLSLKNSNLLSILRFNENRLN
jgi:geranylgeranyl diphosphate synthase type II